MKLIHLLFVLIAGAALVSAVPLPQEDSDGEWKTWSAVKNLFRPVGDWFSSELPKKTPSDIMDDVSDAATGVKTWAQENEFIQGVVQPVQTWVQGGVDSVKDKTFSDLYGNVRTSVSELDDTVGGWMDETLGAKQ